MGLLIYSALTQYRHSFRVEWVYVVSYPDEIDKESFLNLTLKTF